MADLPVPGLPVTSNGRRSQSAALTMSHSAREARRTGSVSKRPSLRAMSTSSSGGAASTGPPSKERQAGGSGSRSRPSSAAGMPSPR